MIKRVISVCLVFVMLFGMMPVRTSAAQAKDAEATTELTATGTNSFGTLLSQDIMDEQQTAEEEAESYTQGYSVTDLEFTGNTATVTYETLEEATLVVAVYSEDGIQMLTSGKTTVYPGVTQADVTMPEDMPQYFQASAYLVDTYDYSPLCASYDTNLYTQEMQELLNSTVDDYDPELVLNLDESETTNFAVFAPTTVQIQSGGGVNRVASTDDENLIYVFENADETVMGLKPGDVFSCIYGAESMVIGKVGTLSIAGSTVTIQGVDLEMNDVFSHVKVEADADAGDAVVDESTGDEGVTYLGMEDTPSAYATTRAWEDTIRFSKTLMFKLNIIEMAEEGSGGTTDPGLDNEEGSKPVDFEVNGIVGMNLNFTLDYYVSSNFVRVELKETKKFSFEGEITLEVKGGKRMEFQALMFPIAGGAVTLNLNPGVEFKGSVSDTFTFTITSTSGVYIESDGSTPTVKNLGSKPSFDYEAAVEGKIQITVYVSLNAKVLGGWLCKLEIRPQIGAEITGKLVAELDGSDSVMHPCTGGCIDGDINVFFKISASAKFLKNAKWSVSRDFIKVSDKIADFYSCYSHGVAFEWGECPEVSYKVTVTTLNEANSRYPNVELNVREDWQYEEEGTQYFTNDNGVAEIFLKNGEYIFTAYMDGEIAQKYFYVDEPRRLTLVQGGGLDPDDIRGVYGSLSPSGMMDLTNAYAMGFCGVGVQWALYPDGTLRIAGKGNMRHYSSSNSGLLDNVAPWRNAGVDVKKVIVYEGVKSIGSYAFYQCEKLESVTIAGSCKSIGLDAFAYCAGLKELTIPTGVETIGNNAFAWCTGLEKLKVADTVKSMDSSFAKCTGLKEVSVPVDYPLNAFYGCDHVESITYTMGTTGQMTYRNNASNDNHPDTYLNTMEYASRQTLKTVSFADGVKSIGNYAFMDCTVLAAAILPGTLTSIGEGSFWNCSSLLTINFPEGLTFIGQHAFSGCSTLDDIIIPSTLRTIPKYAFQNCTGLSEIDIPAGVKKIDIGAFNGCVGLTRVWVDNSVETVGEVAFGGCTALKEVTVPVDHEVNAFLSCNSVETLVYTSGVTGVMKWRRGNGSNLSDEQDMTLEYASRETLKSVTFTEGVTSISQYAFDACSVLETVKLPGTLTSIGGYAFRNCSSLLTTNLPEGLTSMGQHAFSGCSTLDDIMIPSTLSSINKYAFQNCTSLSEIDIPAGVKTIDIGAFNGCAGLTRVWVDNSVETVGEVAFGGCTALKEVTVPVDHEVNAFLGCSSVETLVYTSGVTGVMKWRRGNGSNLSDEQDMTLEYASRETLKSVTFMEGVTSISQYAFDGCSAMEILELPSTLTSIGSYTFRNCSSLDNIIIPSTMKAIPSYAFQNCTSLTEIDIPAGVKSIGYGAFNGCTGLTRVWVDNSVESVGVVAFGGCTGLKEVTVPVDHEVNAFLDCSSVETVVYTSGVTGIMKTRRGNFSNFEDEQDMTLEYASRDVLKSVTFTEGVTSISQYAFDGCTALETLELPSTLTSIGEGSFRNCSSLLTTNLPEGLTFIGQHAFSGCSTLDDIIIPSTLRTIPKYAFQNCTGLSEIDIPAGVKTIDIGAFNGCAGLTRVWVDNSVEMVGEVAFGGCTALKEVTVPVDHEVNAFLGCSSVETVVYTSGVTGIMKTRRGNFSNFEDEQDMTLEYASRDVLKSVTFKEGVTSISQYAFSGCIVLTTVTLPSTLTAIGNEAFRNCTGLNQLIFSGNAPSIGSGAFGSVTATMYYPSGNETWTENVLQNYGGSLNWVPYDLPDTVSEEIVPETTEPEVSEPEATEPEATEPEATEPEATEPEATEPEATEPEATEPEATEPEATEPEVTEPKVTEPEVTEPEVTEPDPTMPEGWVELPPEETLPEAAPLSHTPDQSDWTVLRLSNFQPNAATTTIGSVSSSAKNSIYGGEYESESTDQYTLRSASFSGLVPGEYYLMITVLDAQAEDLLASENLIYIDQGTAAEDGTLCFTYAGRIETEVSYVMACGASNMNLKDAVITFPTMVAQEQTQAVEPKVVYRGVTLTEGRDFVVAGTVDYNKPGTYTCYIRGINNYAGLVECTYQVAGIAVTEPVTATYDNKTMVLGTDIPEITYSVVNGSNVSVTLEIPSVILDSEGNQVTEITETGTYIITADPVQVGGSEITVVSGILTVIDKFNLTGITATFGDSLAMNFVVNTANLSGSDNYAVITKNYADGSVVEVTVDQSDWKVYSGSLYYFSFNGIAAKEMMDSITAVVYNGNGQQLTVAYETSLQDYCVRAWNKEAEKASPDTDKLTQYIDMLNYGAAAQVKFSYDTGNLANAGLTDAQRAYATPDSAVTQDNVFVKGTGCAGVTLTLVSQIELNFVFENAVIDQAAYAIATFTDHYGEAKTVRIETFPDYGTTRKYVPVTGMSAADCGQSVTLNLYDSEGNVLSTCVESVTSMCSRATSSNALYWACLKYCQASYKYFH